MPRIEGLFFVYPKLWLTQAKATTNSFKPMPSILLKPIVINQEGVETLAALHLKVPEH